MWESVDNFESVTGQDSWYQFTSNGDSIKINRLERKDEIPRESDVEFDSDHLFDQAQCSFEPPIGEDENYVLDTEEDSVAMDHEPSEESGVEFTFNIDEDFSSLPTPQPNAGNNKGALLSLLIHQILTSEVENTVIKFDGMAYKRATIFGTIKEKNDTQNNNMITVDDGTGELKCFINSDLNVDDYDYNGDAAFPPGHPDHEFFRMWFEHDRELREELPTFDEMKVGDRVCAMGNLKFYKNEFYLFVEKLDRPKNVHAFMMFLDTIFQREKSKQKSKC